MSHSGPECLALATVSLLGGVKSTVHLMSDCRYMTPHLNHGRTTPFLSQPPREVRFETWQMEAVFFNMDTLQRYNS